MVDKIQKSLNKFSEKEKAAVKNILVQIKNKVLEGLDIKKLKGHADIFRVRKGKIRVIYRVDKDDVYLLAIERRNDNTYHDI